MDRKLVALLDPKTDQACITTLSFRCKSRHPTDLGPDPLFEMQTVPAHHPVMGAGSGRTVSRLTVEISPVTITLISMNDTNLTLNVVVTVLVILFVTLAMGQIIVFNLTTKTKKNLTLHKVIACLGMGAAFYALFIAHFHFSGIGWMGLAGAVIGILFVGSMIQKYKKKKPQPLRKKRARPPRRSVPKSETARKEKGKAFFGQKRIEVLLALFWALLFIGMLLWFSLAAERLSPTVPAGHPPPISSLDCHRPVQIFTFLSSEIWLGFLDA